MKQDEHICITIIPPINKIIPFEELNKSGINNQEQVSVEIPIGIIKKIINWLTSKIWSK